MQPVPTLASAVLFRNPPIPNRLPGLLPAALVVLSLVAAGCGEGKVTAYTVEKTATRAKSEAKPHDHAHDAQPPSTTMARTPVSPDSPVPQDSIHAGLAAPAADNTMSGTPVPTASNGALVWTAPTEWQAKSGSMMRKATYLIPATSGGPVELAVTAFPGDVGGEAANVNRWRSQVGLTAVSDVEAASAIARHDVNGLKIGVVDLADSSPTATRLLGAMVPIGDATWFFKIIGPTAVVAEAKPAFVEFIKTIKRNENPTP